LHSESAPIENCASRSRQLLRFRANYNQRTSLFENFAEERDVFGAIFDSCRFRNVSAVCSRAKGRACSRSRSGAREQRGGANPQSEYCSDAGKKQCRSHYARGHAGCSSKKASDKCTELLGDGFGFAF